VDVWKQLQTFFHKHLGGEDLGEPSENLAH
jgi:hypothetical protein